MMVRVIAILCVVCAASAGALEGPLPERVDFNRDVRPILSENCFFCHGPDQAKRKAGLRLDTKEGLFALVDGKRHPVVAGKPLDSEVYKRIITEDEVDRMPDPESGKTLSGRQIEIIRKWIEQGAEFKGHWAWERPVRADGGRESDDGGNPIDGFLLAKLKEHGLGFSAEADRVTLIRRLYFDLIGLPPTPQQVDAFVNDRSADAYEKLVDSLLANAHFGERMAVWWLDLVRFADTIGYHSDNPRDITPFRDWVIGAFNSNMPFDRFTIEQLAGDLLPDAGVSQKVASGYNRLLQTTEEGGAQPKEYAAKYLADRVRNYSSVWLGATMACAECHDHKFDPFTAKDFYSLAAFFADVKETPVGRREPGMLVPDQKQSAEIARLDGLVEGVKKKLAVTTPQIAEAQKQWEVSLPQSGGASWTVLTPLTALAESKSSLKVSPDGSILAGGKAAAKDTYTVTAKTSLKGITTIRLEALADKSLPKNGPGRADNGNFVLTEIVVNARTSGAEAAPVKLQHASATFEQTNLGKANPYKVWSAASAIDGDVKGSEWGWAVLGGEGKDQSAVFETTSDLNAGGGEVTLSIVLRQQHKTRHVLGKFRVSVTNAARPVRAGKEVPAELLTIVKTEQDKRTAEQNEKVAAYFRTITPLLDSARAELAGHEKAREEFSNTVRRSLVTVTESPRTVRVLRRGNWMDDGGEVVEPAIPAFLGKVSSAEGKGRATRMELAKWTVSRENPLAGRVAVNRLWRNFFGVGLSKNLEDLGSQGEWPTHPELLDWLACEFQEGGWDVKKMIRLMATSRAYRQTSYASGKLKEVDPFNRLVGRQGRFRLDAEFVRDNALSLAGLLVTKIGGESVKPYQPDGYWDFLNFPKRTYVHDKGEGQYRRGLYTHWQRTFPHTSLVNFDAPSREECTAERTRSNTPQQALTLLNDPTYVEASRVFARRIIMECETGDVARRVAWAWRMALGRAPRVDEVAVLKELYAKHRVEYGADVKAAEAVVGVGEAPRDSQVDVVELASWTSVARAILNLHEVITRN